MSALRKPLSVAQVYGIGVALSLVIGAIVATVFIAIAAETPRPLDVQVPRPQPEATSDPAAVAIYERHVKATAAGPAPQFQHSISEMTVGESPATRTEIYSARPDKLFVRNTVGTKVLFEFGYDGTTGWTSSPETGVERLSGPALEAMRASVEYVGAPPVDTTARLTSLGGSRFYGELVDGVRSVSAEGDTLESFYSTSTGLLAGARYRMELGAKKETTVILFRDYKRMGGQLTHTTMIMRMGGIESVQRTLHVDNEPIDPGKFRAPAALTP